MTGVIDGFIDAVIDGFIDGFIDEFTALTDEFTALTDEFAALTDEFATLIPGRDDDATAFFARVCEAIGASQVNSTRHAPETHQRTPS